MKRHRIRIFLIVFLLAADMLVVSVKLRALARLPAIWPDRADAAVVFFRDFDRAGKGLGDDSLRRANHARDLYFSGLVRMIVCLGGARPARDLYGSEFMRQYLLRQGVRPEDILTEDKSFDSRTNWEEAQRIIEQQGFKSVTIIASPFHLARLQRLVVPPPGRALQIAFSAYHLAECVPPVRFWDVWREGHYEVLAKVAQLVLPRKMFSAAVRMIRAQTGP